MRRDCKHYPNCLELENTLKLCGYHDIRVVCDGCNSFESNIFKPCPFCGGEAERKENTECMGHGDYCNYKIIRCKECGAQVTGGYYGDKDDTVKKWNRRV